MPLSQLAYTFSAPERNVIHSPMMSYYWNRFHELLNDKIVGIASILLVFCASIDSVLYMRLVKQMGEYPIPLSQIIYPIAFALVTFTLSLLYYRDRIFCLGGEACCRRAKLRSDIDDASDPAYPNEQFSIHRHWKFITILATIDSITGVATIFPLLYLPSIVLMVLGQLGLPLNLFMSRTILKVYYKTVHYLAASTIIVSVIVASYASVTDAGARVDSSQTQVIIFWSLWLIMMHLINSYLGIFRERKLKEYQLKPWHTMVWVSIIQAPISILLIVIVFLPLPSSFKPVLPAQFSQYLVNAWNCFLNQRVDPLSSTDDPNLCVNSNNIQLFCIFLCFNVIYNAASLILVKLRSTNFAITTSIVKIGFTAFLLSQQGIAGSAYQQITFLHVLGFIGLVLGIFTYNTETVPQYNAERTEDDDSDSDLNENPQYM
jgi:hypothetical protein